jgi:tetratricopeptide (TPR) repeat protein
LQAAVLRQDPDLDLAEEAGTVTPAQLPPVPAAFVGRTAEVARLDRVARCAVISGSAGTGKTTLALHWAHRAAARFPDGQLYVNLRGFGPSGTALEPAEVVRGFLRAFGISGRRLPADPDAQIGLYRSLLAGKRVLVVLDNARDVDQVRPLLPGAAGCAAVVTSRSHLTALVATQDATAVILAQLSTEESRDLLASRLGAERTMAEPDAVEEIVTRSARLPLALAIVAARAATHPAFPLAALADELRTAGAGLDPFDAGDPSADVRSVFSWSYHALSADAAALFRLLGLHPGPDLTAYAAASLMGLPLSRVRRLLTELARAHLLTEHIPGRYAFHDLLRAYAVELCSRHDSPDRRHTALERVLDHYVHTACIARRRFYRALRGPLLNEPRDGVRVEEITDERHALAWFTAERSVLSAILSREPDGFDDHTWPLAWAVYPYLSENGYWHDNLLFQRAGLDAALRSGDPAAKAHAHRNLGMAYAAMDQISEGDRHLDTAWQLSTEIGDQLTAASVDLSITYVCDRRNDVPRALQHAERAYGTFGLLGDEHGQARAGNFVGWCLGRLGRHEDGLAYCEQALGVLRKLGDGAGSAEALDSLSAIHFGLGDAEQGTACSQQAAAMYRDMGDAMNEANTFVALGDRHLRAGNADAASEAWQRALTILDGRGPGLSADVRARLAAL